MVLAFYYTTVNPELEEMKCCRGLGHFSLLSIRFKIRYCSDDVLMKYPFRLILGNLSK